MKLHCLAVGQAVGRVLCHDITMIAKGSFKGPRFKKGHIVREEDVPVLLSLGKKRIYVLDLEAGDVHEDDAGLRLALALAGFNLEAAGLSLEGPSEGRLNLLAVQKGLLRVDAERLLDINSDPEVMAATLHHGSPVEKGEKVAGTRVIPLVVPEETVRRAEEICARGPAVVRVLPYRALRLGVVVTGSEVLEGRVKDGFAPVMREKAGAYGLPEPPVLYAGDDAAAIAGSITALLDKGCSLVIVTGGMSVDPDDVTPKAIRLTGAQVVRYGAPVLPGAMFMLAYLGRAAVVGVPACAMYFRTTVLDLILPRLLAGEEVTAADIAALGHGGFCRGCDSCLFPHCSFGKGVIGR